MTSAQAAATLGITIQTLYAYISRGILRSEPVPGKSRSKRYLAEDVVRLKERKELRGDPDSGSRRSLHWGGPVLESAITAIEAGCVYYRGKDAIELAEKSSVEEVAALLWTGDERHAKDLFRSKGLPSRRIGVELAEGSIALKNVLRTLAREKRLGPIERCQIVLPWIGAADTSAYDIRPSSIATTGAKILAVLASVIAGSGSGDSVDRVLQGAWAPRRTKARAALRAALILCADHELNVSAFTARCVASAAATLYDVVGAGLAAMKGRKHGGMTLRVEALFDEAGVAPSAADTIESRLRRGENLPGFGHPLYPEGDPRGRMLISMADKAGLRGQAQIGRELCRAAVEMTGEHPTLDFGLVALARSFGFPAGSAIALFALGRTIGWIAHAIEQYESGELIRPRAHYVGPPPSLP
ncbi:MAG TPA: citrate synthase family protein [Blastocatellia bacterium]